MLLALKPFMLYDQSLVYFKRAVTVQDDFWGLLEYTPPLTATSLTPLHRGLAQHGGTLPRAYAAL